MRMHTISTIIPVIRSKIRLLVHYSGRQIISGIFIPSLYTEIMRSLRSIISCDRMKPVRTFIEFTITCSELLHFLLIIYICQTNIIGGFIGQHSVLIRIIHLRITGHTLETIPTGIFKLRFAFSPFFSSHQNNAICTFTTIYSRRSIFQYTD